MYLYFSMLLYALIFPVRFPNYTYFLTALSYTAGPRPRGG